MAMIMDDVRRWREEASPGPQAWQAAWERVITLVDPLWRDHTRPGSDTTESDAAAALAVAFYIIAAEHDIPVGQVTRADVEQLADCPIPIFPGYPGYPTQLPERWAARLTALGHDLEADDDPVAVCWRRLRVDHPEPPEAFIDAGDTSLHRVGPVVTAGILYILAPVFRGRFQF